MDLSPEQLHGQLDVNVIAVWGKGRVKVSEQGIVSSPSGLQIVPDE
jgi:hypothetical protein